MNLDTSRREREEFHSPKKSHSPQTLHLYWLFVESQSQTFRLHDHQIHIQHRFNNIDEHMGIWTVIVRPHFFSFRIAGDALWFLIHENQGLFRRLLSFVSGLFSLSSGRIGFSSPHLLFCRHWRFLGFNLWKSHVSGRIKKSHPILFPPWNFRSGCFGFLILLGHMHDSFVWKTRVHKTLFPLASTHQQPSVGPFAHLYLLFSVYFLAVPLLPSMIQIIYSVLAPT